MPSATMPSAMVGSVDELGSHPAIRRYDTTACLRTRMPESVADLNAMAEGYPSVPAFRGGDVGAEVTLQGERLLMVFGDTLRNATFAGPRFVHNSALIFSHTCLGVVLPEDGGAVIPDRADGVGYWPMSIAKVSRPGFDVVGVMAQRVRGSRGFMRFEILGPALAVFRVDRGRAPVLLVVRDLGPDSTDMTRPMWGAASWIGSDGWVYLYGTSHPGTTHGTAFGWALSVARSRIEEVLDPTRWQYWDGTSWQADPARAKVLIPAVRGVSQTLSVFQRGNRWYALSKRDDYLGTDLVVWAAPSPTGPFRASPPIARIPSDLKRGLYRYMPLAHPDLLPEPASVVVSVSQNSPRESRLETEPVLYRPRFLRVPLP
jgi:hypothetical protein